MNPRQERTRTRWNDLQAIAKDPLRIWKNEDGIVSVPKTLTLNGWSCHTGFCKQLRPLLLDEGYVTGFSKASFKDGQAIYGMRLGPNTVKMTTKEKEKPAVYALICEGSGKMYIGASKRPMHRRSVHLYWLKNPDEEGSSNIMAGNMEIMADLEKYGWRSFYFEILETVDTGLRADLTAVEMEKMELHKDKLYNLYRADMKLRRYHNVRPNPKWKTLDEKLHLVREEINNLIYSVKGLTRGHPERKRAMKLLHALKTTRDKLRLKKHEVGRYIQEKHDILTGKKVKGS